jgi:hypothetical protein
VTDVGFFDASQRQSRRPFQFCQCFHDALSLMTRRVSG